MARTGRVERWNPVGGFGSIKDDDSSAVFFAHNHELVDGTRDLREGDAVSFNVEKCRSRPGKTVATNIRRLEAALPQGD